MCITLSKGGLRFIELTIRVGDDGESREGIGHAVLVADTLGQLQSFIRRGFCTTLHLPIAHQGSSWTLEFLYAQCERRSRLSLLSRQEVQRQHAFHPSHSLAHLTADMPEACEACPPHSDFRLIPSSSPLQPHTGIG